MKRIFTKEWCFMVLVLVLGTALSASAQSYPEYTPPTPGTPTAANPATINAGITATTKDSQGNVYTIQCTGDPYIYGRLTGQIVKYSEGSTTGSVISGTNIIPYTDSETANDYPIGIAVDQNFNIYVTTYYDFFPSNGGDPTIYGNIILFAYNSSNRTYTATNPLITGTSSLGIFGALVCDSSGDLFATAYSSSLNSGNGGFELVEYTYNSSTMHVNTTPNVKYTGLATNEYANNPNGDTYSACSAMAIDGSNNIYVATTFDTQGSDGGSILELNSTYTSVSKTIATNPFCIALAVDASGNVYAANGSGSSSAFKLVSYAYNIGTGTFSSGVTEYSGALYNWGNLFPGGLAVMTDGVIFGGAGASTNYPENETANGGTSNAPAAGTLAEFTIPVATQAKSITFTSTTETSTGINWVNGSGGSRAVFVAQSSSQPSAPALSNGTSYTGNSAYGSGSLVGSWYCVYSGTGSSPITVTNLTANKPYWVQVVEYDGSGATSDYNTNSASVNPAGFTTYADPVVTTSGGTDSYSSGGSATTVDNSITVTGGQTDLLTATVNISSGYSSGDALNFTNQNGITGSYSAGTLTLTGSATAATYQAAFRSITFSSTSSAGGSRTVSFTVGDGTATSSAATKTINVIPAISTSGTPVALSTTAGTASSSTSFSVSGTNLVGNITAQAPAGFDISLNNSSWSAAGGSQTINESGGAAGPQTIYVRLDAGDAANTYSGNVSLSSSGATTVNVAIPSSTVTNPSTTISSLTAVSSTLTNAASVQYTATFAASISGLSTSNFSLSTTGVSGASVSGVTEVSGTTWTITVNTGSGDGTVQLVFNNATGITPSVSNTGFSGTTYTIDKTAPTVSIGAPSVNYANSTATISYTVTWSDANLNTGSISLLAGQLQFSGVGYTVNPADIIISGSGATRTVSISNVTGNGSMSFSIPAGTASDNAGNSASASNTSTAVAIDNSPPTVTIGPPSTTLTNTGPVTFDVSYSDAHFNTSSLSGSYVTLNSTGGASATVSVIQNSPTDYSVTLSGITGNGSLGISITPGSSSDLAGNTDIGQGPSTTFTVDNTPPTVLSLPIEDANPNNTTALDYQITFSEPVTGVDATDFTAVTSGVSATDITVAPLSSTVYNITINSVIGNGAVTLDLNSSGTGIQDLAGNAISGGFTGQSYTVDQTPPTVQSITATTPSNTNPTNATSVTYTVTFSEPVTGVSIIGFMATTTNTVASTGITVTPVSSSVYTVTVSGISGDGTLRLDLNNGNTGIFDLAGNPISGGFTSGDVYTIDNTAPTFTSLIYSSSNTNPSYAKVGDVITLTFGASETVQTPSVTIAGHSITTTNTGGNNYSASYTMTSGDTEGRINFSVTVTDLAGNPATETDVAAGDDITFDMTAPTVMISAPSVATIGTGGAGTVTYTVTYADANFNTSNLTNSGITLIATGTAAGTYNVTGSGTSYTVTISSITGLGTLDISVGAGFSSDLAGNTDLGAGASTPFNVVPTDATLTNLTLNVGKVSPTFSPGTLTYTRNVVFGVHAITVTPTASDPNATILINGTDEVASGTPSDPISLNVGSGNVITVKVTAEDGTTTQSYTITVTRGASSNTNLTALVLNPGVKSPGFTSGNTSYTANVVEAVSSTIVTPTTGDPNAAVTVDGTPVPSGTQSSPVPLNVGPNTITVTVTAQDGVTTKTYTVIVTRAGSTDADLTLLRFNPGIKIPIFMSSGTSYTANVVNAVSSTIETPTATDPNATIMVNNVAVASGTPSGTIPLNVGPNVITTVVTASDGVTTKTYTVTITRAGGNDDLLSKLKLSAGTESPVFTGSNTSYTDNVANSVSSITVTPTAFDPNATIVVDETDTVASGANSDPIALAVGPNTITVHVTAQDGSNSITYTVTVNRAAPPSANTVYVPISVDKPTETPTLADDGIQVHQGVSPNGDGINDFLQIDNINQYPDNKLSIMNRNGQLIYEARGYDNSSKTFDGHSNKNGQMQLPGTYFYQLDYAVNGITKHKTGFIILKY